MSRILPYPLLAASLLVMWLLLNGISAGHVFLGSVIALGASRAMMALQPSKPRLRRWGLIPKLILIVLKDITASNIAVSSLILFGKRVGHGPGFVAIPLKLRDPTALALLACIITSTPGTAWIEYRASNGHLLIHVLDLKDAQEWIDQIKSRYERILLEIFE